MAKTNKFIYTMIVQGCYGGTWEDLCAADLGPTLQTRITARKECREDIKAYREAAPEYSYRIIRRREINPNWRATPAQLPLELNQAAAGLLSLSVRGETVSSEIPYTLGDMVHDLAEKIELNVQRVAENMLPREVPYSLGDILRAHMAQRHGEENTLPRICTF